MPERGAMGKRAGLERAGFRAGPIGDGAETVAGAGRGLSRFALSSGVDRRREIPFSRRLPLAGAGRTGAPRGLGGRVFAGEGKRTEAVRPDHAREGADPHAARYIRTGAVDVA